MGARLYRPDKPVKSPVSAGELAVTAYPNTHGVDAAGQDRRRQGQPAPRVLIALTNDPALSRAVQELVASGIEVGIVQTAQALSDELVQHASAIALVDCATVDAPIEALVDAIAAQFPDLRLLVAGHSTEQNLLATRIAKQTVFRFVHKPASAQRLKLFLDAVGRQSDSPRPGTPSAADAAVSVAKPAAKARAKPLAGGGSKSRLTGVAIGVGIVLIVALGVWLLWPKGGKPGSPPQSTPAASTVAATGPAGELIGKADQAFAAGRYVDSDGTSAAELYRDALKIDTKNDIAHSGFDRSIEYGLRSAEEALLASRVDAAAIVAENIRLLVPNNSRLAFLQAQIARETARVNADASQRQVQEAKQARIKDSLDSMTEAMGRGALLEPSRNNAVLHFRAASEIGAADPAVRNARDVLIAALLTAADNELSAQRLAPATRLVDAAASINSSAPGLDVLRRRVRELQAQAEAQAAAAKAAPPPPQPAAEPVAAAAANSTEKQNTVVSESTLQRISKVDPNYPQRALDQLVSGWVELQFTVAIDGSVQDVVVMDSQPHVTFDKSAMAALRRWRYQPVVRDGVAVPQRAVVRMRFTAVDPKR
jgi:protein TonB